MRHYLFALVTLIAVGLTTVTAQEKPPAGNDFTKVSVSLAANQLPEDLKAGEKVDLFRITGQTVTRKGVASITTSLIAGNLEVISIKQVERPKEKDLPVEVELKVTKVQAESITRAKNAMVTVMETGSDGKVETKKMPVPMRLERTKSGKK